MSTCPACAEPLFGWLLVGSSEGGGPNDSVVLERCERCRLGVAANLAPANSASALLGFARQIPNGKIELRVANRASVQASLGGGHWAALEPKRRLYPTPQSLPGLAAVPVALVSAPLELFAALLGRGGELVAVARPSES